MDAMVPTMEGQGLHGAVLGAGQYFERTGKPNIGTD